MSRAMPESDPDYFRTVETASEGTLTEKGSKFLGRVLPVKTVEEAAVQLDAVRKTHHDATHHCFAWRLGYAAEPGEKYSDAGEPSGTAGRPILDAICAAEIWDVLVVVMRWFGGTKLGTGGLKRAYRQAADLALGNAAIVTKMMVLSYRLGFPHDRTGVVYRVLDDCNTKVLSSDFGGQAHLEVTVKRSEGAAFVQRLTDAGRGKIQVEPLGERVR